MILTNKQEEGLKLSVERYYRKEPYTCIAGYAGTGKSTLVKFIIAALNLDPKDVAYVAFTGKAANVLAQKGCPNATTAHKLLYRSKQLPNGNYIHEPRPILEHEYKLIIVDEISMLPKDMWNLLLTHHIPIICCGDPEQLPPIDPNTDNQVLNKPHIFLDEIMRQAAESEIIRLSMFIREGNDLTNFPCSKEQVQIISKKDIVSGMYNWADQIICATNKTRNDVNEMMRILQSFPKEPQQADKIISLSNHWDFCSPTGSPLTNGSIGHILKYWVDIKYLPPYIRKSPLEVMYADVQTEDGEMYQNVPIDYEFLLNGKESLDSKTKYRMKKNLRCPDPPFDFTYGYAITCHKSQGSEWNKILLYEESFPFEKEEHRRWLYTAITRASEKIVVVKK